MDFIHIWHDGRYRSEWLSRYSYQQEICLSVRPSFEALFVHTLFLSLGQSFCVKVYKTSYFEDPLMDFIHIWHDGSAGRGYTCPTGHFV